MVRFITFSKLTEKGMLLPPEEAPGVLAKVAEIIQAYGGKLEEVWASSGRYDFITLAQYPDEESGFRSRTKIMELGLFHLESNPVFPVETFIEAVVENKVPVATP